MKKILLSAFILLSVNALAYDFSIDGRKYSYNSDELKFYQMVNYNKALLKKEEVKNLFPDYEVILISEFNDKKKITVKNSPLKSKKILLLNDTQRTFHRFDIYPKASRAVLDNNTNVKSLILIHGNKNVRLKHPGGDEFEIVAKWL